MKIRKKLGNKTERRREDDRDKKGESGREFQGRKKVSGGMPRNKMILHQKAFLQCK